MKLTVHMFMSLDGVVQGPGADIEDPSNGFDLGGWLVPYIDDGFNEITESWFHKTDSILLGRTTYDMMYGYWPQVTDEENLGAVKLNNSPKYVASNTLTNPEWNNSTVLSGDIVEKVRELKEQPGGELQIHGSAGLARSITNAGLVDEFRLLIFPVVLGKGKKLFADGTPPSGFNLIESRTTASGIVYVILQPTPFKTGELGIEDGKEII